MAARIPKHKCTELCRPWESVHCLPAGGFAEVESPEARDRFRRYGIELLEAHKESDVTPKIALTVESCIGGGPVDISDYFEHGYLLFLRGPYDDDE